MDSRMLVNLRVDKLSSDGFGIKFEYGQAWGDQIDIVTVSVPMFGQMRSYHWSKRNDLWLISINHKSKSGSICFSFDKSKMDDSKENDYSAQLYWQKFWN